MEYLNNYEDLISVLLTQNNKGSIYLFGVTFALLDLAEKFQVDLSHVTVIETGGKQHIVYPGLIIKIAKLDGEMKEGKKVTFDNVLVVDDGKTAKVGTPTISKNSEKCYSSLCAGVPPAPLE